MKRRLLGEQFLSMKVLYNIRMFKFETLVLGELETNCYLLWEESSKETIIIDAADDGVAISEEIEKLHLKPKYILSTHGHFDHNLGVLDLKLIYSLPFGVSSKDQFLLSRQQETASKFLENTIKIPNIEKIDIDLDVIKELKIGKESVEIIRSPGHTPGGISFRAGNFLFTGDTIFANGLRGDTKHSYSSTKDIFESICALLRNPGGMLILPGHGETTDIETASKLFTCSCREREED